MSEQTADKGKSVADQRGPYAVPFAAGISPAVRADLGKLTPELRESILDVVKRKTS